MNLYKITSLHRDGTYTLAEHMVQAIEKFLALRDDKIFSVELIQEKIIV
jgi:hypothetical protein